MRKEFSSDTALTFPSFFEEERGGGAGKGGGRGEEGGRG